MARMHKWLGLAFLGLSLTGCVSQEKYTAMKLRADQLASDLNTADQDAANAKTESAAYKEQLDQLAASGNTSAGLLTNLNAQLVQAKSDSAKWEQQYEDLLKQPPQVVTTAGAMALPAPLSNELSSLAEANPDVIDFDAARGVVKFKSDVTFAPGSTDVSSNAQAVLQRFAAILNSQAAVGYDLMVAGHTDNTRIVKKETIEQGNFDNWYLSAHRAIAVAAVLVQNGVSKSRLGVAGYADQRPIASNATEAGKAENRRVEIMILPTTTRGTSVAVSSGTGATRAKPAAQKLNKDSAAVDERNK